MTTTQKTKITVQTIVDAPLETVWNYFTQPSHIIHWNNASPDWHTPRAENDLQPGGSFTSRMEAKDGSMGFDFEGVYQEVEKHSFYTYLMEDGRHVKVSFREVPDGVEITEIFDAEMDNSTEMQKDGWQAILENFKTYTESSAKLVRLHFEISIKKSPSEVYRIMLEKPTYEEWTDVFSPGSTYIGTWEEGSQIQFVSQGEEGNQNGMVSKVVKNVLNKHLDIEHLGVLKEGVEVLEGKEVEMWKGAHEKYTFKENGTGTLLLIDLDSTMEFDEYFTGMWPKALDKLKEICERNG
ncbi:SRPBCC domain-containing protein [Algoriphagus sp. D3-2-R+10]|uniref:SRPBCC domain-containing protein n=1 Tax=Algoriphagus aurantiacus TaxID=3103948 RepID=UPI002B39370B|nr:SRPBCC domain-containing protein [Algoriphagus sp. D3-2-R+10]MEB2774957.1 SRPBCC domain-containing protein [Algoriphagus sp. D3-2-R+10]